MGVTGGVIFRRRRRIRVAFAAIFVAAAAWRVDAGMDQGAA
jgi:hypothetical protein